MSQNHTFYNTRILNSAMVHSVAGRNWALMLPEEAISRGMVAASEATTSRLAATRKVKIFHVFLRENKEKLNLFIFGDFRTFSLIPCVLFRKLAKASKRSKLETQSPKLETRSLKVGA